MGSKHDSKKSKKKKGKSKKHSKRKADKHEINAEKKRHKSSRHSSSSSSSSGSSSPARKNETSSRTAAIGPIGPPSQAGIGPHIPAGIQVGPDIGPQLPPGMALPRPTSESSDEAEDMGPQLPTAVPSEGKSVSAAKVAHDHNEPSVAAKPSRQGPMLPEGIDLEKLAAQTQRLVWQLQERRFRHSRCRPSSRPTQLEHERHAAGLTLAPRTTGSTGSRWRSMRRRRSSTPWARRCRGGRRWATFAPAPPPKLARTAPS